MVKHNLIKFFNINFLKRYLKITIHNTRNKIYWIKYYKTHRDMNIPSSFATYCYEKYLSDIKNAKLLELGCGNGRDAIYFSNNEVSVVGLDLVNEQLKYLRKKYSQKNLIFLCKDFSDYCSENTYDFVYSRFTMHTITEEQENSTLENSYKNLKPNGLLMIEVRSIKDDMYLKSRKISKTEAYTDHYRRFAIYDDLLEKIKNIGFEILESVEDKNLAVYKDDNPYVIRIIAQKK